ncbi:MAG: endonuclease/exonuclease/phosphatase family protein [Lachnospiraceae bacterium]|nr:endonuclease/exonuclease/phosphatase family protein [Lachnospiraceae bacterium]
MKKTILILLTLCLTLSAFSCGGAGKGTDETLPGTEQPTGTAAPVTDAPSSVSLVFSVMSQNLRCANDPDGNSVKERTVRFEALVRDYYPDIIGTQETTAEWNAFMKRVFDGEYGFVGCSRNGKNAKDGEWNTLLYSTDVFELVESDTFWLTETYDECSKVPDSLYPRICTWALLKEKKTGIEILACNTHLDHSNDDVRAVQVGYLLESLSKYVGSYPMVLTGDFNATVGSGPYQTISAVFSDAHKTAEKDESAVSFTYHAYGKKQNEIDFIFYDPNLSQALSYKILDEMYDGYVSDHYGVICDFRTKGK